MAKKVKDSDEQKKRYEVSLASPSNPSCYLKFYTTNSLADAKEKCVDKSCDEDRECIVLDNEEWGYPIIFRHGKKEDKDVGKTKRDGTQTTSRAKYRSGE